MDSLIQYGSLKQVSHLANLGAKLPRVGTQGNLQYTREGLGITRGNLGEAENIFGHVQKYTVCRVFTKL